MIRRRNCQKYWPNGPLRVKRCAVTSVGASGLPIIQTLKLPAATRVFCHPHDGKHTMSGLALREANEQRLKHARVAAFECRNQALTTSFTEQMPAAFEKSRLVNSN
jgi:hypothetical protein